MQQLKNTLTFNLAVGSSVVLPHGLQTILGTKLVPDVIVIPSPSLSVTADDTAITLTNNGPASLSGAVLVESWHTIERAFGDTAQQNLPVQPYIIVGAESGNEPPQPPYPDPNVNVTIYARVTGSDVTGDGRTIATAYLTIQRAVRDVPSIVPTGIQYFVNYTGIGQEALPDGYELPTWKAPAGYWYDDSDSYFPIRAAVNLRADPMLTPDLAPTDAVIAEADLVPTTIGGGVVDLAPFNDVRNSGTGDGALDAITDEGGGVAKLQINGEDFDGDVTFITIALAANPANNGTFPVLGTDGDSVFYDNPGVVPEAAFAGTYVTYTPYILVETVADHGLWHVEFPVQNVTLAGVLGSIAPVADGEHVVIWRTKKSFIFAVDDPFVTSLVWGGTDPGTTVSVLFVQDPTSGNVQIKTNKNFGADDSLAGKLLISSFNEFWNAVIYHNTADTLFLTHCFAPGAFGTPIGDDFRVMEQSAELLTTCSFAGAGERRGPHRGGLTIANCDSISLNGTKVTPLNDGEIGLCQVGGTLITAGCHLTTSRFNDAQGAAMSQCTYMDNQQFKGSAVDLERCYILNQPDPFLNGPVGWFYAYFGTVFREFVVGFDGAVESDLFACKFIQDTAAGVFFAGRNTWNGVSFQGTTPTDPHLGWCVGASGSASRNRLLNCEATHAGPTPCVVAFNGGQMLINSDVGPYGDASFTEPGDFMVLDGLPNRTFEDFRQHALLDVGDITSGTGGQFDSVFEAIFQYTSSPSEFFGDPAYPSIESVSRPPDAGGVIITYNPATGLVGISFENGVSTNLDVETAVDVFAWPDAGGIRTKIPSPTPGAPLVVVADEFAATPLDVGVNGPCGQYTDIRANPKTGTLDCPGSLGTQATVLAYSLS
jgi:hypothetical protein